MRFAVPTLSLRLATLLVLLAVALSPPPVRGSNCSLTPPAARSNVCNGAGCQCWCSPAEGAFTAGEKRKQRSPLHTSAAAQAIRALALLFCSVHFACVLKCHIMCLRPGNTPRRSQSASTAARRVKSPRQLPYKQPMCSRAPYVVVVVVVGVPHLTSVLPRDGIRSDVRFVW